MMYVRMFNQTTTQNVCANMFLYSVVDSSCIVLLTKPYGTTIISRTQQLRTGQFYIDTVLPFGLRSAPKIFNCIADALQWIAKHRGVTYLDHFLDDFVTVGAPGSPECTDKLLRLVETCTILNIPLAITKSEGPTTCLIFLGIEVDTMKLELRLPAKKLLRLQSLLQKWISYKCC